MIKRRVCLGWALMTLVVLAVFFCGWGVKKYKEEKSLGQRELRESDLSDGFDANETYGVYGDKIIPIPKELAFLPESRVLGTSNSGQKRVQVDLTTQHLYAFEGDRLVYDFLISSGKWGKTPTGIFNIWGKFRYTKMEGGSRDLHTYYYLPNVPYVMFFANNDVAAEKGFSLHGTYWHKNFGVPMSHGCINMRTEEAAIMYEWSEPSLSNLKSIRASEGNPGTKVIIYGEWVEKT